MHAEVILLRLIHILSGTFWFGGMLVVAFFLMPALAGAGPAAGPVMAGLNQRKYPQVVLVAAILTILSGLRLLMIDSATFNGAYFQSPVGRTFGASSGLAIVAFVFGMIVTRPAMMNAGTLAAQMPTAPDDATRARLGAEMAVARKRGAMGSLVVVVLLSLAVAGMAVARYTG